jgi:hypothetical protein
LVSASECFRAALSDFDADCYTGSECAAIAEALVQVEKACSAVRELALALLVPPPE